MTQQSKQPMQRILHRLEWQFLIGLLCFILTVVWLSLFRVLSSLILVSSIVTIGYGLLFLRWLARYVRFHFQFFASEQESITQNKETVSSEPTFFVFRRH